MRVKEERGGGTEGRKDWPHSVTGMPGREKMGLSTISNGLENSYLFVMQKLRQVQGRGHSVHFYNVILCKSQQDHISCSRMQRIDLSVTWLKALQPDGGSESAGF